MGDYPDCDRSVRRRWSSGLFLPEKEAPPHDGFVILLKEGLSASFGRQKCAVVSGCWPLRGFERFFYSIWNAVGPGQEGAGAKAKAILSAFSSVFLRSK